ncbi:MAG: hypothetical protein IIZ51_11150, partial [Lachnospiraceae bacterium]|nr:hypothetical protein [Lachnospiraceae bacterium]
MNKDQSTAVMERDVRELSLGDMLIQVFRHWKAIVIAVIIGAVVFTGLSCYLGVSGPTAQRRVEEATASSGAVTVSEAEQAQIDALLQMREHFQEVALSQSEYIRNSVYMQLDPYAVNRAVVMMWITPEGTTEEETIDRLITLYQDAANSKEILEPIAEEYGMEYRMLREIVGCGVDYDYDRVWVSVAYTDMEMALTIAQQVVSALQARTDGYSTRFGNHSLEETMVYRREQVETGILDSQTSIWTNVQNNNNTIEKIDDEIEDI